MGVNQFTIKRKMMRSRDGEKRPYVMARVVASGSDIFTTEVRFYADVLDDGKMTDQQLVAAVMERLVATIERVAPGLEDSFWDEVALTVDGATKKLYQHVGDWIETLPQGV